MRKDAEPLNKVKRILDCIESLGSFLRRNRFTKHPDRKSESRPSHFDGPNAKAAVAAVVLSREPQRLVHVLEGKGRAGQWKAGGSRISNESSGSQNGATS